MKVGDTGLTTVLKVKQFQEKSAQKDLASLRVSREAEEHKLGELEHTQDDAMNAVSKVQRTSAGDLQTGQAFLQSLSRQIHQQEERVDDVKQREDAKRDELLEKSKSRQMVEKLDDRRRDEAVKASDRKAQRVIDILAQRSKPGAAQ